MSFVNDRRLSANGGKSPTKGMVIKIHQIEKSNDVPKFSEVSENQDYLDAWRYIRKYGRKK